MIHITHQLNEMNVGTKWCSMPLAMHLPLVLNDILMELMVGVCVFNLSVCLKKCLYTIRVSNWLHTATDIVL